MAGYSTPYPPPPNNDWRQQRRFMRDQARMQRDAMRQQSRMARLQYRAARRSSILTPLVLIVFGVVFLLIQMGRLQSSSVWNWYANWWPLLLVAAGVVVLAEWSFDQFFRDPAAPAVHRRIGGLWLLFFILIATGSIAHHGLNFDWTDSQFNFGPDGNGLEDFFGNRHETDQPFTETLPAGASVSIDNPRGNVNISGVSDDGQLHVQLHRAIYTNSDSDASSKAQQLVPKMDTFGNQVTLSLPFIANASTDMIITVPAGTPITVKANRGDLDISSLKSTVNLTANRGNVTVQAITGAVTAQINNGNSSFEAHSITGPVTLVTHGHDITLADITGAVAITGNAGGSTHLQHINGAASFHSSRTQFDAARLDGEFDTNGSELTVSQAVGPVTLNTYSYNITLDRVAGDTTLGNRNGSVDFIAALPLGNVTIDNRHSNVTVTLPQHANFSVEALTNNGQIASDFPFQQQQQRNNRGTLTGTVGSGGSLVRITTSEGDIALRQADLQPLPAPPAPAKLTFAPSSNPQADAHQAIAQAKAAVQDATRQVREETRRVQQEARHQNSDSGRSQ